MNLYSLSSLYTFALFFLICSACVNSRNDSKTASSSSPTPTNSEVTKTTPMLEIPKLIGRSPEVFQKFFGKETSIGEDNLPGFPPEEIRDYSVPGANPIVTDHGMMVTFTGKKAVNIMVDLRSPTTTAEAALWQVGLNVNGIPPTLQASDGYHWRNQTINGIKFKDVAALRMHSNSTDFTTVEIDER